MVGYMAELKRFNRPIRYSEKEFESKKFQYPLKNFLMCVIDLCLFILLFPCALFDLLISLGQKGHNIRYKWTHNISLVTEKLGSFFRPV